MFKTGLKTKYYYPIRRAYRQYQQKQAFQKQLRPQDGFVVGHPKSGNTWVTLMVGVLIEENFQKKINIGNIAEFVPSFHNRDFEIANYAHFPDPRFFRNEGPLYADLYPRTIYIVRDPRAAYVSYYHHCVHDTGRKDWEIDDFVDEILANGCIQELEPYLIRWDRHVAEWRARAKHQPVFFAKYEDMKQDCLTVMKNLVDFLGLPCSDNDIQHAVERGDFKNMRKEEMQYGATPYSGTKGEGGFFVRKGKVDGWMEELPQRSVDKIVSEFAPIMKQLNYV